MNLEQRLQQAERKGYTPVYVLGTNSIFFIKPKKQIEIGDIVKNSFNEKFKVDNIDRKRIYASEIKENNTGVPKVMCKNCDKETTRAIHIHICRHCNEDYRYDKRTKLVNSKHMRTLNKIKLSMEGKKIKTIKEEEDGDLKFTFTNGSTVILGQDAEGEWYIIK